MAIKSNKSAKARGFKLVSFEIESELWQDFKIHSIKSNKTSSALIRELISNELKEKKKSK